MAVKDDLCVGPSFGAQSREQRTLSDGSTRPVVVDEDLARGLGSFGVELVGPKLFRIYERPRSRFSTKYKHVVEPTVAYRYSEWFDRSEDVQRYDEIDGFGAAGNTVTYGLRSRLIAKRPRSTQTYAGRDEVLLCYLPLFHTFGRYLEMLGTIFWGGTYVFAGNPSAETLLAQLQEVRPTALISVPVRWVQIRDRIMAAPRNGAGSEDSLEVFRAVVRGAFEHRRKTCYNSLLIAFNKGFCKDFPLHGAEPGEFVKATLEESGILPEQRPETITIEQFAGLARAVTQAIKKGNAQEL